MKLAAIGLTIVFSVLIGLTIGLMSVLASGLVTEPQEQYYRGVYDACRWLSEEPHRCMEMATGFEAMKMYREESPGWVWTERKVKALPMPRNYPNEQTPSPRPSPAGEGANDRK